MTIKELDRIMEDNGGYIELKDGRWISDYGNSYELHQSGTNVSDIGFGIEITAEEALKLADM